MIPSVLAAHVSLADAQPIVRLLIECVVGAITYAIAGSLVRPSLFETLPRLPGFRRRVSA
jgi:hypothetical protein